MTDISTSPAYTCCTRSAYLLSPRNTKVQPFFYFFFKKNRFLYSLSLLFLLLPAKRQENSWDLKFQGSRNSRRILHQGWEGCVSSVLPLPAPVHCWLLLLLLMQSPQNTVCDFLFKKSGLSSLIKSCSHLFQLPLQSKVSLSKVLQGKWSGISKDRFSTTLKPLEKGTAKELTVTYMKQS